MQKTVMQYSDAHTWINTEWSACYNRPAIKNEGEHLVFEDPIRFACGRARGILVSVCRDEGGPTTQAIIVRLKYHQSLLDTMVDRPASWRRTARDYYQWVINTLQHAYAIDHTIACRTNDHKKLAARALWRVTYPSGCTTCGATGFVGDSDPDVGYHGKAFCESCVGRGICPECGKTGIDDEAEEPTCPHCGTIVVEGKRDHVLPYPDYDYCNCHER